MNESQNDLYYAKYMKYKNKYTNLKEELEGAGGKKSSKVIFVRGCYVPWADENIFKILDEIGFPTHKLDKSGDEGTELIIKKLSTEKISEKKK